MNLAKYLSLGIIFTLLGYAIGYKLASTLFNLENKIKKMVNIKRFHVHHDFFGLFLILTATFLANLFWQIAVAGIGFGLFIHHTTTEGFKFITKN